MFSIKKMLVDLYDSRTAQSCSASIGDIMNLKEILYLICDYPHKHYTFKHFEA